MKTGFATQRLNILNLYNLGHITKMECNAMLDKWRERVMEWIVEQSPK